MANPTNSQIEDQLDKASHGEASKWPGMSYEEGVSAALGWALGHYEGKPMEEN